MKKLMSLSSAVFLTVMAFAQDTIPAPPGSSSNAQRDTIPKNRMDTSMNRKWPDTSTVRPPSNSAANSTMPVNRDTVPTAQSNTGDSTAIAANADKVLMKDDKVMVVKNGDSTLLQDSILLGSGAVVKSDATVLFRDGSTAKLKNGQYIALTVPSQNSAGSNSNSSSGNSSDSSTTTSSTKNSDSSTATNSTKNNNSDSSTSSSSSSTTTNSTTEATPKMEDRVVMINDKVMVVKNGDSTALSDTIKLGSGAVVKADGSVRFKDGTTTQLKNGQYINLSVPAKKTTITKRTESKTKSVKKKTK